MSTGPREADDRYFDVAVKVNPDWRIIRCEHQRQWILQTRYKSRWDNRIYTSCPQTLSEFVRDLVGHVDFDTEDDICSLPKGAAIGAWVPPSREVAR